MLNMYDPSLPSRRMAASSKRPWPRYASYEGLWPLTARCALPWTLTSQQNSSISPWQS